MGKRYSRSAYIAVVLIEGVPDSCPGGTLTGVYTLASLLI